MHPHAPLNFLLIEDEALIVMDLQCAIEDAGHCVLGDAASFKQLSLLNLSERPNVVFIDLNLAHGESGLDACCLVKNRWPETYVVFVTANPTKIPSDFDGSHGVIAKPFTYHGLLKALEYLGAGICAPPPTMTRPQSLITFKSFETAWAS